MNLRNGCDDQTLQRSGSLHRGHARRIPRRQLGVRRRCARRCGACPQDSAWQGGRGDRRWLRPLRSHDGHGLPAWTAGAHVDLVLDKAATRQYSLCGDPDDLSRYRLGILRDPNGRGSSLYVHDELKVGDTVRVRGPRNNFALDPSPSYLFIAGGIGITPILPMIQVAEKVGADWRLVSVVGVCGKKDFLDELAVHGDRVSVCPQDETGLLDLGQLLGVPRPDILIYCCGPEPLLAAVEKASTHWPPRALHLERFTPKP